MNDKLMTYIFYTSYDKLNIIYLRRIQFFNFQRRITLLYYFLMLCFKIFFIKKKSFITHLCLFGRKEIEKMKNFPLQKIFFGLLQEKKTKELFSFHFF